MFIIKSIILLPIICVALFFATSEAKAPVKSPIEKSYNVSKPIEDPLIRPIVPKTQKKTVKAIIKTNNKIKPVVKTVRFSTASYNASDIDRLLKKYFGNSWQQAKLVMLCESGGNPNALNTNANTRDYSVGLFQINLYGNLKNSRPSEKWLRVAENNIKYASQLYGWHGFRPWLNCARKNGLL